MVRGGWEATGEAGRQLGRTKGTKEATGDSGDKGRW